MLGSRIVPLLVADGHEVAAMTRSAEKVDRLRALGAEPVLCDGRILAQSIAWRQPGREEAVELLERQVLETDAVVLRYGQLYGPGTFYEDRIPGHPRINVDEAAKATIRHLDSSPDVYVVAENNEP